MKKLIVPIEATEPGLETMAFLLKMSIEQLQNSPALRDRTKISLKDLQTAERVRRQLMAAVSK
ncbi:hypothetical protein [Fibrisoma limi]|uniref:hypothetical protein n=1 Tax=Fibrisoma limi TaxID=663275 RepID=UPI0002F76EF7|nr:hypothetical protein [Fibrisoma limi]